MASAYRLQFVPNWKGMITPDTTPTPNATENIRIQNIEIRR